MIRLNTTLFNLSHDCFSEEASTVGYRGGDVELLSPGGEVVRYRLVHTDRDNDGDALSWRFMPYQEDVTKYPHARRTSVVIYND